MPLDRHARFFLEMLAAAGHSRGRYDDIEERRTALTNLAALADPPGSEAIGGVRDQLRRWASRHACCLQSCSFMAAAGLLAAWKPMTVCAAG